MCSDETHADAYSEIRQELRWDENCFTSHTSTSRPYLVAVVKLIPEVLMKFTARGSDA